MIYDRWLMNQRNAERAHGPGREGCRARVYAFFFAGRAGRGKTRGETRDVKNEASMSFDSESSDDVAVDVRVAETESRFRVTSLRESRVDVAKLRRVERFYREPFFALVAHPVGKILVVAGFAALLVFGVVMASQLETPRTGGVVPGCARSVLLEQRRRFMSSDEDRVVPVRLGLGGMNTRAWMRPGKQRGSLVLDSGFDASSAEAQAFLVSACDSLKTPPAMRPGAAAPGATSCATADARWSAVERFRRASETTLGFGFPVAPRGVFRDSARVRRFEPRVGVLERRVRRGGNLVFVRVGTENTLVFPTTAGCAAVFDVWQAWVFDLNARAPAGVANAKQTAYYTWTWMKTQEALVQNTFQGLIICFCMAFVVLLLSTMDLRAGLIATVTIAGVVTTVMGVGVRGIMGWDLGIGESIAAVILIGLSVDYCVHLANAYCEAPASLNTRELRVQHALATMGISITAARSPP